MREVWSFLLDCLNSGIDYWYPAFFSAVSSIFSMYCLLWAVEAFSARYFSSWACLNISLCFYSNTVRSLRLFFFFRIYKMCYFSLINAEESIIPVYFCLLSSFWGDIGLTFQLFEALRVIKSSQLESSNSP